MVALPHRSESKVNVPAAIRPHDNGKIPDELLKPCGLRNFLMAEPAARACNAMVAAAAGDGIRLDATGTYRSYEAQKQMFLSRFSTTPIAGQKSKTWNGTTYWLMPGNAMAATPGNSKHGWALAADLAQRSSSGRFERLGPTTLSWLAERGPSFGFWNSVKSEPWHWPYFPGDDIPDAVLQMERQGAVRLIPEVPANPTERERFYLELSFEGVLARGARGPGVEAVQWALSRSGFRCGVDGVFGPLTERTVKTFQAATKLPATGVVDETTWTKLGLMRERDRPEENSVPKPKERPPVGAKPIGEPQHGAVVAAAAAYRAGFRGKDLAEVVMIAGRESGWRSDAKNPHTSDRGMWQINFSNLQRTSYDALRERLGINHDTDLLDLDTNAAVAFSMYQDSINVKKPWFPWRGSETGGKNGRPGWDGNGSHLWRTEKFAAESKAAAKAVTDAGGKVPVAVKPTGAKRPTTSKPKPDPKPATRPVAKRGPRGTYTITAADADGISALVGRCVGIADAPWAIRRAAAEAVVAHSDADVTTVWQPGDVLRFPAEIPGVRSYEVQQGDGPYAISAGLGLGRSKAAVARVQAINEWQGGTPHPGDVWYGGAA